MVIHFSGPVFYVSNLFILSKMKGKCPDLISTIVVLK